MHIIIVLLNVSFLALIYAALSEHERRVKAMYDDLMEKVDADNAARRALHAALERYDRTKRTEIWNIRLLRQEVLELVRKAGGKIDD